MIKELRKKIIEARTEKQQKTYERTKLWKSKNKEKIRLQGQRYYKKHINEIKEKHRIFVENGGNLKRYGLSLNDYTKINDSQNGVCAICNQPETIKRWGKLDKLSVDHDHKTEKIRGLLCNHCNRGLGCFKDDENILKKAIIYLKNHGKK